MSESSSVATLTERMKWYRDGCEGLEDREGYLDSGDVARDAARDLETALSEIRVLERVIAKMRPHMLTSEVVTIDAVKAAIGFLDMPKREMVLERLGETPQGLSRIPMSPDAEALWEELGGDLCVCQRPDVVHWCESCQRKIEKIMDAFQARRFAR